MEQRPTLGDVIAVIGDYAGELRPPFARTYRANRRPIAFVGIGASILALLCIEALFAGPLATFLLIPPILGISASAVAAWLATPAADPTVAAEREAALRAELDALSDSRVALVIRQFEWAVNDVERLRQAVRRAEAAKLAADKHATDLELRNRQFRSMVEQAQNQLAAYRAEPIRVPTAPPAAVAPETFEMRWSVHEDGAMRWLRLETDETRASRVRLLDPHGLLVTISDPAAPASPRSDGPLGFILEMSVPADVLADLASDALRHRFEALVGDEWRAVTLSDSGVRTGTSRDKRSRVYVAEGIRSIA